MRQDWQEARGQIRGEIAGQETGPTGGQITASRPLMPVSARQNSSQKKARPLRAAIVPKTVISSTPSASQGMT